MPLLFMIFISSGLQSKSGKSSKGGKGGKGSKSTNSPTLSASPTPQSAKAKKDMEPTTNSPTVSVSPTHPTMMSSKAKKENKLEPTTNAPTSSASPTSPPTLKAGKSKKNESTKRSPTISAFRTNTNVEQPLGTEATKDAKEDIIFRKRKRKHIVDAYIYSPSEEIDEQ